MLFARFLKSAVGALFFFIGLGVALSVVAVLVVVAKSAMGW